MKALALSSSKRSLLLPNVPIFAEVGLEGYQGQAWWGLGAPKGTPPAVLARINAEFVGMVLAFGVVATLASVAGGWVVGGLATSVRQPIADIFGPRWKRLHVDRGC